MVEQMMKFKKDLALKLYRLKDKDERLYEECMTVLPRDVRDEVTDAMQLMVLLDEQEREKEMIAGG